MPWAYAFSILLALNLIRVSFLGAKEVDIQFSAFAIPHFNEKTAEEEILVISKIYSQKDLSQEKAYIHYAIIDTAYKSMRHREGLKIWDSYLPYSFKAGGRRDWAQKSVPDSFVYGLKKSFKVPRGRVYEVCVALELPKGKFYSEKVWVNFFPFESEAQFSGILFFDKPQLFGPMDYLAALPKNMVSSPAYIYGYFQLKRYKRKNYTLTKVIFRKDSQVKTERATHYASDFQEQEALSAAIGLGRGSFIFSLANKPAGEYLVEVYLMEEGKIVSEVVEKIYLQWSGYQSVINNLSHSIESAFILGEISKLLEIKNKTDKVEQKIAFFNFWRQQLVVRNLSFEEFYQRRNEAEVLFGKDLAKSDSVRMKYYILLGPPANILRFEFEKQVFERWFYQNPYFEICFSRTKGPCSRYEFKPWAL
jgi:GWxTD domain-containing protein